MTHTHTIVDVIISHFVRPGYGSRNDVFPIYIGDDQTDEDAFEVGIFCM